jgi:hypothetical protein
MTTIPKIEGAKQRRTVVKWLLDSDPLMRRQVMRDPAGQSDVSVAVERARIATESVQSPTNLTNMTTGLTQYVVQYMRQVSSRNGVA